MQGSALTDIEVLSSKVMEKVYLTDERRLSFSSGATLPESEPQDENTSSEEHTISGAANGSDPLVASKVHHDVQAVTKLWHRIVPLPPLDFLTKLLKSRGYDELERPLKSSSLKKPPSDKQVGDYTTELILAVRNSDLERLKELHEEGMSMNACNKYGESIVHLACRRSSYEVVHFILHNGGDPCAVDDFGRTPFHDACWRTDPRFDIIALLLEMRSNLVYFQDVRGAFALSYVVEDNWLQWCAFLFLQRNIYWPQTTAIKAEKGTDAMI